MNKIDAITETNYTVLITVLKDFESTTLKEETHGLTLNQAVEVYSAACEAARRQVIK